ncbi:DUF2934 domain-containing protein [Rhizobium sp. S163]|uniref:DUF2934 domain-containing protein n=1 Tax=Rhizobium sp. S163 TaxID=3055039 RepID=UPI0025A99EBE|nr:DUF2934 domain-containing protein [Rhizobium sp. S163]MDM9646763.1 DUF2934 domain-containing protein [Rhizobium sp. S163]
MGKDLQEHIRTRAYEIWLDEGQPEGADLRHWLQAADELSGDETHETLQELLDEDDREDEVKQRREREPIVSEAATTVPVVEITTGREPARRKIRQTEGP